MKAKRIFIFIAMFMVLPLLAAPAPWHQWQSKIDGKVFCTQTSPGGGWKRLKGVYKDLRCHKSIREKPKKEVPRFGLD